MVPDLDFRLDVLTAEEEAEVIAAIDEASWETTLKRRVQQYGHRYNYGRAQNNPATVLPAPAWATDLFQKCRATGLNVPDVPVEHLQIIVNEYEPGQGISAHVDDSIRFSNWVMTVTLNSGCGMRFREREGPGDQEVFLNPRSAYLMRGQARYSWTHEIAARKTDKVNGRRLARGRRISVTFRAIRLD
jgi:alkylated DNA repair dioxygenase AlkB